MGDIVTAFREPQSVNGQILGGSDPRKRSAQETYKPRRGTSECEVALKHTHLQEERASSHEDGRMDERSLAQPKNMCRTPQSFVAQKNAGTQAHVLRGTRDRVEISPVMMDGPTPQVVNSLVSIFIGTVMILRRRRLA